MTARQGLGALGERLAAAYLAQRGYHIIARNLRLPPWGEVDIVAERDGVTALIEVRTRRGARFGGPFESITPVKRARMLHAAAAYAARLDDECPLRIDVVGVTLDVRGRLTGIEHIENAIEVD